MNYEVKASWMHSCGRGLNAKVYPVLSVSSTIRGMTAVTLDLGNGRTWVVIAEWRGRFV